MAKISDTHRATLSLYLKGMSPKEIAKTRELSLSTIISHLYRLAFHGSQVDVDELISSEQITAIQDTWLGLDKPEKIRPVFDAFDGSFDWEQIRYAVCLTSK
jgi:ATP-dependent DNA helicase RecQ